MLSALLALLTSVFCVFLKTKCLRALGESSTRKPLAEEMPQEVDQNTHETREER